MGDRDAEVVVAAGCLLHCVGHVDPPQRPRALQPVPHRRHDRRSAGGARTRSPSGRSSPPRRCTRSSGTGATARRSQSRRGSSGSPTRSTWRAAARGCRSRRDATTSTRCRPMPSTRSRSRPGEERAVRVEIAMSNSAGIFQVDELLGREAPRLGARGALRGGGPDRGRARGAADRGLPDLIARRGSRGRLPPRYDPAPCDAPCHPGCRRDLAVAAPAALATTQTAHAGDVTATFTFQGKVPTSMAYA